MPNVSRYPARCIHGDKRQEERDWVLGEFKGGRSPILVATDVAARGLGEFQSLCIVCALKCVHVKGENVISFTYIFALVAFQTHAAAEFTKQGVSLSLPDDFKRRFVSWIARRLLRGEKEAQRRPLEKEKPEHKKRQQGK